MGNAGTRAFAAAHGPAQPGGHVHPSGISPPAFASEPPGDRSRAGRAIGSQQGSPQRMLEKRDEGDSTDEDNTRRSWPQVKTPFPLLATLCPRFSSPSAPGSPPAESPPSHHLRGSSPSAVQLTCLGCCSRYTHTHCVPRGCGTARCSLWAGPSARQFSGVPRSPRDAQRTPRRRPRLGLGPQNFHKPAERAESRASLPALCLLLSSEESHQAATKNTTMPALSEGSRRRWGAQTQLTSLYPHPHSFWSPESPS